MPALSYFLAKFLHAHVCHHVSPTIIWDVHWWISYLKARPKSCSLSPRSQLNPQIFVDASTICRIGILVANKWATWKLKCGWQTVGPDIGCAELIALELATLWLVHIGYKNVDVTVHSDNIGVIGAFHHGRSRNLACNEPISHTTSVLLLNDLSISPVFVPLHLNRADSLS